MKLSNKGTQIGQFQVLGEGGASDVRVAERFPRCLDWSGEVGHQLGPACRFGRPRLWSFVCLSENSDSYGLCGLGK